MKLTKLNGDVTNPVVKDGTRIILHCTNQLGIWGSGVVIPIKRKWAHVEDHNIVLCKAGKQYNLILEKVVHNFQGQIQPIYGHNNTII